MKNFANRTLAAACLSGYDLNYIFNNTSIYIVPMVNPDGVDLVTGSISNKSPIYKSVQILANQYPNIPFPSGWKANINGVDLNLQYPARLEKCKAD